MSQTFGLTGKRILVTGGTRGIGRAASLQFAEAGAHVLANFIRGRQAADSLADEAAGRGLHIELCRGDLTSEKGLAAVEEAVADGSGSLDGLMHCAATGVHKPFDELTVRHFDWTFALNVRAFFELVQRLLPRFSKAASIVAVSSQGADRVVPAYSILGASKGALEALSRHLAAELAPSGVRVNILSPGSVRTESWDAMPDAESRLAELTDRTPRGSLASAEEVAQAAQFLFSDAASAVIGQTLVVDGGASLPV